MGRSAYLDTWQAEQREAPDRDIRLAQMSRVHEWLRLSMVGRELKRQIVRDRIEAEREARKYRL